MTQPAAFRASYSDWKLIRTRQAVQVIFEIPLSDADAAYKVLGGMPDSAAENWFAIAALNADKPAAPKREKRDWRDLPPQSQAAMRCNEGAFPVYLRQHHSNEWHETGDANACIKLICGIASKTELASNHKARTMWQQIDSAYQAWLAAENAA